MELLVLESKSWRFCCNLSEITTHVLLKIAEFSFCDSLTVCYEKNESSPFLHGLKGPTILESSTNIIHAGLCNSTRLVIQNLTLHSGANANLMGFKGNLLKSYESMCDWRLLFEQQLPTAMQEEEQLWDCLSKLNHQFTLPAVVFNSCGLAKKFLKQCKSSDVDVKGTLRELLCDENWFLRSSNFKTIVETGVVPNIFCCGPKPTIVDIILLFYIAEIVRKPFSCKLCSLSEFAELRRWFSVMLLKFEENLNNVKSFSIPDLLRIVDVEESSVISIDWLIASTDTGYKRNPDQVNQGRWLPRGDKRKDILSATLDSVGTPVNEQHPNLEWMQAFQWGSLPDHVNVGNFVPLKRAERKKEQVLNIVAACLPLCRPGYTVVDFCSGGGHVGLLLAHLLPDCRIVLLDNKLESLQQAEARVEQGGVSNVQLLHCSIEQLQMNFEVGVSLHACGASTDIVLSVCFRHKAHFAICPCCYGNIRFAQNVTHPRSGLFKRAQVSTEHFSSLTKGADNSSDEKLREICMNLVDFDRLEEAKDVGYKYSVLTKMHPASCSPKNNIIIASFDPIQPI